MATNDTLKLPVDPRLQGRVEKYMESAETDARGALTDLLEAGLSKLEPRAGGANGKRKAKGAVA